jgi:hypothetical protein
MGRVSEPELRARDLLAGPRGRELCARLAGMDVREMYEQLAPSQSVPLVRVPGPADVSPQAPELGNAAEMLRAADAEADEDERRMSADRHLPAGSGVSGPWWTRPGVLSTTRRLGRLGAVLLAGQEDGFGDTDAVVWPVVVSGAARVLEIDGPQAWQRLVTDYPRPATATYRHTWAWTGWDGDWVVPRWSAVARDWDGVHLRVAGYLATAGRALPVGTARTLLGGWNPDETYWLTDVLRPGGDATRLG